MLVTLMPTEAGTMPLFLLFEFVKTIADGLETLAQAAIFQEDNTRFFVVVVPSRERYRSVYREN